MAAINVKSEIMPLKKVMLHRPGDELLNLTPDTLEQLLFDDIPYLEVAQQEHDAFADILRSEGVEVLYLEDLMAEVLENDPGLREQFVDQIILEAGVRSERYQKLIREYLGTCCASAKSLVLKTMAGVNRQELGGAPKNTLADLIDTNTKLYLPPMPNLYFTRDPFACIGNGVSVNRMYSFTRNRETIYGDYIFKYHPVYKNTPEWYKRVYTFHIEGGDILNINEHTLAIGISQRTEPEAIDRIARDIFDSGQSPIDTILAFQIPKSRAFMHLDTVFTQVDYDKFTIHPAIMGPLSVFELTPAPRGEVKVVELKDDLENILTKYVGHSVELLPCGAGDRIAAEREQWNDGSNTLCIRPGTIIVYSRNNVTNDFLYKKGLNVLEMPSSELSRGRGGPRCMSMPFERADS